MTFRTGCRITLLTFCLSGAGAYADEQRFDLNLRAIGLLGDGVPANDIIGIGIAGRYHLRDGWFVGAALEDYEYDFERPIEVVGLRQDPAIKTIDAVVSTTVLSGHLGRIRTIGDSKFDWFWTLGIGVAFPDAGSATGPTDGGGTFNVTTDAGTEVHLMSALGLEFNVTKSLAISAAARAEHHFIDLNVTEQVSGATGKVDSQSPLGMNFGVSWRF